MKQTEEPIVSICCLTYNQEKYIKDAIDGFLIQKTQFPFEIIIHDDASTDTTANIVREYEKQYPEKIKGIYQTENQFSKGVMPEIQTCRELKGKYIAFCEGDDYWTDPLKLQKQITEMEKNPECYISFHPAIGKSEDKNQRDIVLNFYSDKNKIFSIEEVILGGGGFIPTASIVINKLVVSRISSFFALIHHAYVGDYFIQILGAENGGALYLSDIMSVYRMNLPGSFSEKFLHNPKFSVLAHISTFDALKKIDIFTNYKYTKPLSKRKREIASNILLSLRYEFKTKEIFFNNNSDEISIRDKVLWYVIFKHPNIIKILKKIRYVQKN
jgi:glycosyltransferase involved in cell wall biosynthesis